MSTLFHPEMDEETKRTKLGRNASYVCIGLSWNLGTIFTMGGVFLEHSYHASIGMSSYEALYGRSCRTPMCWIEVGERKNIWTKDSSRIHENIKMAWKNMRKLKIDKRSTHTKVEER